MSPIPPLGVLFDWDGVVVDSHAAHESAWDLLAAELGQTLPPGFFKATFGMRNDRIIPNFTPWAAPGDSATITALGLRKEALYRDAIRASGIEPLPGVRSLLESLRDAHIPCAVGSSTDRANIDLIMELTGLAPFFNTITAAADVQHGKPAPDVFLHAAASIGIDPHLCVVIEDAHAGIEAALAANCKAVAVATTHPVNSFPTAHLSLVSVADLSLADLQALWPAP
jgi:beta-phosphoglucomutase family hydrolase